MKRQRPQRGDAALFVVAAVAVGYVAVQAIQAGHLEGWGLVPLACVAFWQATRLLRRR